MGWVTKHGNESEDGWTKEEGIALETAVLTVSVLSMIGACFIILSYVLVRELRTTSRLMLVFLSMCDFVTAAGNSFGLLASPHIYGKWDAICIVQSSFTTTSSISSFLWTASIGVYLYLSLGRKRQMSGVTTTTYGGGVGVSGGGMGVSGGNGGNGVGVSSNGMAARVTGDQVKLLTGSPLPTKLAPPTTMQRWATRARSLSSKRGGGDADVVVVDHQSGGDESGGEEGRNAADNNNNNYYNNNNQRTPHNAQSLFQRVSTTVTGWFLHPTLWPYHIVCWGIPIVTLIVALSFHALGENEYSRAVGWCWISSSVEGYQTMWGLIAGKGWEVGSYIVTAIFYMLTKWKLHRLLQSQRHSIIYASVRKVISQADNKLVLVPVIFVMLRIWGTVRFFMQVGGLHIEESRYFWLAFIQGMGDTAQGFANFILFCLLTKKVRKQFFDRLFGVPRLMRFVHRVVMRRPEQVRFDDDTETVFAGSVNSGDNGVTGSAG
eukprot:TRINITY_DN395_c2_g1_i2.p1 TRINITY_DN395_c2_g1~~TRINITY_DN395_c2_g1_i2.p1  ORF type:complete len:525 (-),score=127.59 TRINITY_DN395_c2_g1_i2:339-1811(-)